MAFAHVPAMYTRYDVIERNENSPDNNAQKYADFLQQQTRKCKRDGYLDSDKYINRFMAVERNKERQKTLREPPSTKSDTDKQDSYRLPAVQSVYSEREKFEKAFDTRMSAIDMELWQSKKEQRQLRRFEGDFVKSKQQLREMLRKYQKDVETRQLQVDGEAEASTERFQRAWQDYAVTSSNLAKTHVRNDAVRDKTNKLIERKQQLKIEKLANEYSILKSKLSLKMDESSRMYREFERKLVLKESEQSELKRRLAELAISIHMESKKRKDTLENITKDDSMTQQKKAEDTRKIGEQLEDQIGTDNENLKRAQWERRRLSEDAAVVKDHVSERMRDEDRKLKDTQNSLQFNKHRQDALLKKELETNLDRRNKDIELQVREAEARRQDLSNTNWSNKLAAANAADEHARAKANARQIDWQIAETGDEVEHLGKIVEHDTAREAELWRSVRKYEFQRNAAFKDLQKLEDRLLQLRNENYEKLRTDETECKSEEQKLLEEIKRVKMELDTAQHIRESSYFALTSHRSTLKQEQHEFNQKRKQLNKLEKTKQLTPAITDSA